MLFFCPRFAAETDKWKKISYAFMPVVALYAVFVTIRHNSHEHHDHEQVKYPFIKKRDKPMPWALAGGTDCDLFDTACGAKARAAARAAAAE